jgi:hypothetical protein
MCLLVLCAHKTKDVFFHIARLTMDTFSHLTSFFTHVLSPDVVPQAAQGLFSSVLFIPLIFNTLDYFQKAEDKCVVFC